MTTTANEDSVGTERNATDTGLPQSSGIHRFPIHVVGADSRQNEYEPSNAAIPEQTSQLEFQFLKHGLLFDRRQQIRQLEESLKRRLKPNSTPELILIAGASGTGKTVLARNLQRSVQEVLKGFFVMGKFDQLKRSEPFAPLVAAMTEFVFLVLEKGKDVIDQVKSDVLEQVGSDIRALTVLVPALKALIGPQPDEGSPFILKSADAEERLKAIFVKFVRAACSCSRPLVLVMDDLQWADMGSLELLEAVAGDAKNHGLVVVGICRSNEVSFHHDLAIILRRLEDEKGVHVTSVEVNCLSLEATNSLISSVLNSPEGECLGVTEIVHEKTKGNVFFIVEFVKALTENGVLTRDGEDGKWLWHDELWASKFDEETNGILNLTIARIQRLAPECQQLLLYAACLGTELDESLLSKLFEDSLTVGAEAKGVLYDFKASDIPHNVVVTDILQECDRDGMITKESHSMNYRFLHDRVQEAAYNLVPANDRAKLHLSLGRFLSKVLTEDELQEHIFVVVDQMNRGLECIKDENEKIHLASLCLLAGKKAIVSSDFRTSLKFLELGLSLLVLRQSWRDDYELTLNLYNTMAQTSCCLGDFERTDEAVKHISANARCFQDELHGLMLQIYSLGIRFRIKDCLGLGSKVLDELGEPFPKNPGIRHILMDLFRAKRLLRNMSDESILALPDMKDPVKLSAMGVLNLMSAPCLVGRPNLLPLLFYKMLKLSIRDGLSAISSVAFSGYGIVLANTGDHDRAYRLGQLGLSIVGRYNAVRNDWIPRVYAFHYGMVSIGKETIRNGIEKLSHAHQIGMECGDLEFGFIALHMNRVGAMFAGYSMVSLEPKMRSALDYMKSRNQTLWFEMTTICYESILALMGRKNDPVVKNGCLMTLDRGSLKLAEVLKTANLKAELFLCVAAVHRLVVAYHDGDFDLALKMAKKSRNAQKIFATSLVVPYQMFYDALTCLALVRQRNNSVLQNHQFLSRAKSCLSHLRKMGAAVAENYMQRAYLIEAEFLVYQRKPAQALFKYAQAQEHARLHGYADALAIACEREAVTRFEFGKAEPMECFEKAIVYYEAWGAYEKSQRMRRLGLAAFCDCVAR